MCGSFCIIKGGSGGKYILTIAGESGSGKSEIAAVLAEMLAERGIESLIIQQDDYFIYPPQTNLKMRLKDNRRVGISEVRLELLDRNMLDILSGKDEIEKPLAMFDEDCVRVIRIPAGPWELIRKEDIYEILPKLAKNMIESIKKNALNYDLMRAIIEEKQMQDKEDCINLKS